jgi:sigma-B regulation protein RsbU (phosphoserine phosphatase)
MSDDDRLLSVDDLLETGRMREQLEIARRIQRGFLPKAPPGLHGFDIDGWNEPCHETGGDYYDFLRLPGGRLGLAVGDVSSHGIGPALLMASARSALRALFQVGSGPGDVLSRLNDVLAADMLEEHFMTMFVGVLDLRTKRLRYALAGHERPLLLPRGGRDFVRLKARGMPLGIQPGIEYEEGPPVLLRKGDLAVCVTDGAWEATNTDDEEFGYPRLETVLRAHRDGDAAHILSAVRAAILDFVGDTRQADDITLLVLKAL